VSIPYPGQLWGPVGATYCFPGGAGIHHEAVPTSTAIVKVRNVQSRPTLPHCIPN
jgi:hypothetical protein